MKEIFTGFKKGMNNFNNLISTLVNSILLLIVYILGVGLTSITAKIIGKHFLQKKTSKKVKTYWSDINLNQKVKEDYYRQF